MAANSCAAKKHSKNYSTNSDAMKRITSPYIRLAIAMFYYALFILALSSCRSAAPLISVPRNDSIVIRDRFVRDSIIVRDSVFVRLKNDTVFIDRWHNLWRDRTVATTDTVYKDKEVLVQLPPERYVPWLYRVALYVCIALVLLIIIRICVRRFCGFR